MTEPFAGLHRSDRNRLLAGVCGGLGETWRVDPVVVRLFWALLTLMTFVFLGAALYILAWILLPVQTAPAGEGAVGQDPVAERRRSGQFIGGALILAGLYLLADRLTEGLVGRFLAEFWRYLWPIACIAVGAMLLLRKAPERK